MRRDLRYFFTGLLVGAAVRTVLGDENMKKIRSMLYDRSKKLYEEYKHGALLQEGLSILKDFLKK